MDRRKLPIGIRTFREIREEDCCHLAAFEAARE